MAKSQDNFKQFVSDLHKRAGEIYRALAKQGIRVFCLSLKSGGKYETQNWIHDSKTVVEWREDIREFLEAGDKFDEDGRADDRVHNALMNHLRSLGYAEVEDVVADVFEGRIANRQARIEHDPAHEEQADGFGHYGWENGRDLK